MRIRKNAKLSPLLFSAVESVPEVLHTHVCQLNQSPWDVISLEQHATNQLEDVEDSFNETASLGDSIGAVESVASMMEESAKLSKNNIVITNESEVMAVKNGDYFVDWDENEDGFEKLVDRSWKCKKQFKEEDYSSVSSDHHHRRHTLFRSSENNYYSTSNNCSITNKSTAGGSISRRPRPVRASKKAVGAAAGGSNPYEFYYYSGFGPLWGKKRRERGGGEDSGRSSENTTGIRSNATTPSPSEIDGDELDFVEDDDDEDEEEDDGDGDGGKKRMRKPVKARSLKSLM